MILQRTKNIFTPRRWAREVVAHRDIGHRRQTEVCGVFGIRGMYVPPMSYTIYEA